MALKVIEPKISVIMSVYNGERHLSEAIESIICQTYTEFELIIINDGSLDKTVDVIKSFSDPRIVFLENKNNIGLAASLNKGILEAKGGYIVRMDADDVSLPNRLQLQYEFMQNNPDITVCGSSLVIYDSPDNQWKPPCTHEEINVRMLFECCLYHPSVIFRKDDVMDGSGGYDATFSCSQDYDLWQRLSRVSTIRFANLAEPLIRYRVYTDIDRSDYKFKQKELAKIIKNNYLKQLEIYPSAQDYSYHQLFACFDIKSFEITDLEKYSKWLDKIAMANDKHCIFPPFYLRQELKYRWLKLCLLAAYQYPLVAIGFLRGDWSPYTLNSLYHFGRMIWRARKFGRF